MPHDLTPSPVRFIEAPGFNAALIDTSSEAGREAMRAMFRDGRERAALAAPRVRLLSMWASYRQTQRNDRLGRRGYFANAAEARAEVRQRVADLRAAKAAFDAREAA